MKSTALTLILVSCFYQLLAQQLVPYRKKDKWGYSDISGKIKIKPRFQYVAFFHDDDDYSYVSDKTGVGLITRKGKIIVPCIYRHAEAIGWLPGFQDPVCVGAIVTTNNHNNGLYGLPSGKLLLDTIYPHIYSVFGTLYHVKEKNNKEGIFDGRSGKWIAPPIYDNAFPSSDYEVKAVLDNKEFRIPVLADGPGTAHEQVREPDILIIDESVSLPAAFPVPLANAATSASAPPPAPPEKQPSPAELFAAQLYKKDSLYGFRFGYGFEGDSIPPIYDSIDRAGEFAGVVAVKKDGRWGIVNSKGKILMPLKYEGFDLRNSFIQDQLFVVKQNNKKAIIDQHEKIITTGYDKIQAGDDRFFILQKNDLYGILFLSSMQLIEPKYYRIEKDQRLMTTGSKKIITLIRVESGQHPDQNGYVSDTGKQYFTD